MKHGASWLRERGGCMQATQVSKVRGVGIAALIAAFALFGVLFSTQPAYAAEATDSAASAVELKAANVQPDLAVPDQAVDCGATINVKAENKVDKQTGSWKWEIVSGAEFAQITAGADKDTVTVQGLAKGEATLKVTFTTNDFKKVGSTTAKVTVNGAPATVSKTNYEITSDSTAILTGVTNKSKKSTKKITVNTVKVDGKTYKVTEIAPKALANMKKLTKVVIGKNVTKIGAKFLYKSKKVKTIYIKTKKLTKASVKNSLKGSSVKTVKVPKSKVKAYKKIFTKKNCGKKVKVVAI